MQDPNPLPWGAQDRFQAHFIVRKQAERSVDYTARTVLKDLRTFSVQKKSLKLNGKAEKLLIH